MSDHPYRDLVDDTSLKLDMIATQLMRRASLQRSSLSPARAIEWAATIRGAEELLRHFSDDLKRQRALRRSA